MTSTNIHPSQTPVFTLRRPGKRSLRFAQVIRETPKAVLIQGETQAEVQGVTTAILVRHWVPKSAVSIKTKEGSPVWTVSSWCNLVPALVKLSKEEQETWERWKAKVARKVA